MSKVLRIGTRGSALALWQAEEVQRQIGALPDAPATERVIIKTRGDMTLDIPLWTAEGKGFFTAELDRALLDGEVDLVVHSLKDLATTLTDGTTLAATLEREDPRDALISRNGETLASLPAGSRVGTSSLRRRAFLKKRRPDLVHMELRGNVPTRVRRLDEGHYDAIILATAGLKRLGLADRISEFLPTEHFPNAAAQGAVAVCTRGGDEDTLVWVRRLDHPATRIAVEAERAMLNRLEGGCQVPVGALATVTGGTVTLYAAACGIEGVNFVAVTHTGPAAEAVTLGRKVADDLVAQGASEVLAEADHRRKAAQHSP